MLDLSRPMQTRDGRKVQIYCTDAPGQHPIHGAIFHDDRQGCSVCSWASSGAVVACDVIQMPIDLVNVPEPPQKREVWLNVYQDGSTGAYATWTRAEEIVRLCASDITPVARVRVEFEFHPGDGLTPEEKARLL